MGEDRYEVLLSASGSATYEVEFGKLLRPGRVRETEPPGLASGSPPYRASLEGTTHRWVAEGPIRLRHVGGEAPITVETTTRGSATLEPGQLLQTSCPCYRRRVTAAGVLLGAAVGGVSGYLLDQQ